jgi:predicted permease
LAFSSGEETPIEAHSPCAAKGRSRTTSDASPGPQLAASFHESFLPRRATGNIVRFPDVESPQEEDHPNGIEGWARGRKASVKASWNRGSNSMGAACRRGFSRLPPPLQRTFRTLGLWLKRFFLGLWEFMSPPLWAMLVAIVVASVPRLQHLFFAPNTFLSNSVTRAIEQSGGVAVPLILVVLGANLERSTLPKQELHDYEDPAEERKLIIASLLARMLLPTLIMGPILAITAKFVPVSILDDPIFIVVCFLLTGAPSALQLAQICQINGVFMGAMSSVLFQSYVIW